MGAQDWDGAVACQRGRMAASPPQPVTPAKAGVQADSSPGAASVWIPASAGMSGSRLHRAPAGSCPGAAHQRLSER